MAVAIIFIMAVGNKDQRTGISQAPASSGQGSTQVADTNADPASAQAAPSGTLPKIGEKLTTTYFEATLNEVKSADRIRTGGEFVDVGPEDGNRFIILNVTFKNIDSESRMLTEGSLLIQYNGKMYEYDNSESFAGVDGWGTFLDQMNPLTSKKTNIVYKIPAEIKGPVYWEPGRNLKGKRFYCGNL